MLRICAHQPELWPLPRLLAKWAAVDVLVLLDIVHFNRASLQHRCRLLHQTKTSSEERWLTIPFQHVGHPQQIRVVEPANTTWPKYHANQIREWYREADPKRLRAISDWYKGETPRSPDAIQSIAIHAWHSMTKLAALCDLDLPPVILASALIPPEGGWGQKSDLVLNICKAMKADRYLAGVRGSQYLDYAAFERAGVSIEVQAFAHPPGMLGRSQAELSALHTYLTEGPDAVRVAVQKRGGT